MTTSQHPTTGFSLRLAPGDTLVLNGETAVSFTFGIADAVFERTGYELVVSVDRK